jgi:hypothetical protein
VTPRTTRSNSSPTRTQPSTLRFQETSDSRWSGPCTTRMRVPSRGAVQWAEECRALDAVASEELSRDRSAARASATERPRHQPVLTMPHSCSHQRPSVCSGGIGQRPDDCPGSMPAARITRAPASSPAQPHRPGRVRRIWPHGGGPLPARLRPDPATRRWRVGAWQPSLAGRASANRSCDPCPATCDGSSVPARRADAGRGVTGEGQRGCCNAVAACYRVIAAARDGAAWSPAAAPPQSA